MASVPFTLGRLTLTLSLTLTLILTLTRFEKFERMMSRILLENQYPQAGRDDGRPRQRQRPTALPATATAQGGPPHPGPRTSYFRYTYYLLLTASYLLTILTGTGTRATRRRSCCVRSGRSTLTTRLGLGLGSGLRVRAGARPWQQG